MLTSLEREQQQVVSEPIRPSSRVSNETFLFDEIKQQELDVLGQTKKSKRNASGRPRVAILSMAPSIRWIFTSYDFEALSTLQEQNKIVAVIAKQEKVCIFKEEPSDTDSDDEEALCSAEI